jgi:copper(I)-binding protein
MRRRAGTTAALVVGAVVVAGGAALALRSDDAGPDGVEVTEAWAAPSTTALAVYLGIDNGGADDRLVAASSDVAGSVSLMGSGTGLGHTSSDGAVPADLAVPEGTTELRPGESHLMFEGLDHALAAGDRFPLRLTFERAGAVDVEVEVLTWDEVAERAG